MCSLAWLMTMKVQNKIVDDMYCLSLAEMYTSSELEYLLIKQHYRPQAQATPADVHMPLFSKTTQARRVAVTHRCYEHVCLEGPNEVQVEGRVEGKSAPSVAGAMPVLAKRGVGCILDPSASNRNTRGVLTKLVHCHAIAMEICSCQNPSMRAWKTPKARRHATGACSGIYDSLYPIYPRLPCNKPNPTHRDFIPSFTVHTPSSAQ